MGEDEKANFIATCHDSFGNDLGLLLRPQRGVRVR
jgi:hypothetical protein